MVNYSDTMIYSYISDLQEHSRLSLFYFLYVFMHVYVSVCVCVCVCVYLRVTEFCKTFHALAATTL